MIIGPKLSLRHADEHTVLGPVLYISRYSLSTNNACSLFFPLFVQLRDELEKERLKIVELQQSSQKSDSTSLWIVKKLHDLEEKLD